MITYYQIQVFVLAAVVLLTAFDLVEADRPLNLGIVGIALLLIILAFWVKPLLRRATHYKLQSGKTEQPRRFSDVDLIWLYHGRLRIGSFRSILIDLLLTCISFWVAYRLTAASTSENLIDADALAISLALLLLGLFIIVNNLDIIAQVIGLLIMDHGLFLAAVKIIPSLNLEILFTLSLIVYISITLFILSSILPALSQSSGSIELRDQQRLKG
jgi:hydrogenase-4 membrane subunit HyfE